jgi:hypothetical protein
VRIPVAEILRHTRRQHQHPSGRNPQVQATNAAAEAQAGHKLIQILYTSILSAATLTELCTARSSNNNNANSNNTQQTIKNSETSNNKSAAHTPSDLVSLLPPRTCISSHQHMNTRTLRRCDDLQIEVSAAELLR